MTLRSPSTSPPGGRSKAVTALLGLLLLGSVVVIALDQTGRLGGGASQPEQPTIQTQPSTPSTGTTPTESPKSETPSTSPGYGGLK